MLASSQSATLLGVEGRPVRVEVHVSEGLPGFTVVGMPDTTCREARDRVRAALLSGAAGVALGLLTRLRWPMADLSRLDLSMVGDPGPTPADLGDDPPRGQVLVTVEYTVDADDAQEFLRLSQQLEPARRRDNLTIIGGALKTQNLAGYIDAKSGRRLAYALFVNDAGPITAISDVTEVFDDHAAISNVIYELA